MDDGCECRYVLKEDDRRGSIDAKKVKAMGLPPGKSYEELINGRDVVLPNGTVIKAAEVSRKCSIWVIKKLSKQNV